MNKINELRINAYVVLVMAERKKLEDVPKKYRDEVEVRIAEKTLEVLGN